MCVELAAFFQHFEVAAFFGVTNDDPLSIGK
jgi:hypothetical protein